MTFLSVQTFNDDGVVEALSQIEKTFTAEEAQQPNGLVRGKIHNEFKTETYSAEDAIAFPDTLGAEAFVLTECEVFWPNSAPPIRHVTPESRAAHRIALAMSNIATKSKRGAGNTVIYNPAMAEDIEQAKTAIKTTMEWQPGPNYENNKNDMVQVTVSKPYFSNPEEIDWIEHENAPEDKVLVLYRGKEAVDQPLIYVEGTGLILNSRFADVGGYGKFTKIT